MFTDTTRKHRILKFLIYSVALVIVAWIVINLPSSFFVPRSLTEPTPKDWLFSAVVNDFDAPQICDKISPTAYQLTHRWSRFFFSWGGPPQPPYDDQYDYLQSVCYEQAALHTHDALLCKKVRPLSVRFIEGSCSVQDCENKVRDTLIDSMFPSSDITTTNCVHGHSPTEPSLNSREQFDIKKTPYRYGVKWPMWKVHRA